MDKIFEGQLDTTSPGACFSVYGAGNVYLFRSSLGSVASGECSVAQGPDGQLTLTLPMSDYTVAEARLLLPYLITPGTELFLEDSLRVSHSYRVVRTRGVFGEDVVEIKLARVTGSEVEAPAKEETKTEPLGAGFVPSKNLMDDCIEELLSYDKPVPQNKEWYGRAAYQRAAKLEETASYPSLNEFVSHPSLNEFVKSWAGCNAGTQTPLAQREFSLYMAAGELILVRTLDVDTVRVVDEQVGGRVVLSVQLKPDAYCNRRYHRPEVLQGGRMVVIAGSAGNPFPHLRQKAEGEPVLDAQLVRLYVISQLQRTLDPNQLLVELQPVDEMKQAISAE